MSEKGLWVGQSGPSLMNGVPRCSTWRLFSTEILCLSVELREKKSEISAVVDLVDLAEGKNKNLELVRWGVGLNFTQHSFNLFLLLL